jgi:hypothetical protein
MSEIRNENDPPPVLSYANANVGGAQPVNSRFVCEYHEDGVTLTEPPPMSNGTVQIVLGITATILGFTFLVTGIDRYLTDSRDISPIVIAFITASVGIAFMLKGRSERRRPFVIEIRNGRFTLSHRSLFRWRRSWRTVSMVGIKVSIDSHSVPNMRMYSEVLAMRRWGLPIPLLSRPKDECLWVAKVLRDAMNLPTVPGD